MLASDSNPPLRPEGMVEEGRRSLPTLTRLSDREYTKPLLTAFLRQARSEPTVKQPSGDARSVTTQRIRRSK